MEEYDGRISIRPSMEDLRGYPNYSITILSRSTLNTKNQEHNEFLEKICDRKNLTHTIRQFPK